MAKDRFSKQASTYAKFRPSYPPELYEFVLERVVTRESAWDCATGNGQAASVLARHFKHVHATDISQQQLANAKNANNIQYQIANAENPPFGDNSFDLITVAQAAHWFNLKEFYHQVNRVGRPNGVIALWGYGLFRSLPEVDQKVQDFYAGTVGNYWDFERKHIEDGYSTLPFPFKEIEAPLFEIKREWMLSDLEGYLNSWSSVQNYIAAKGANPVKPLIQSLENLWPNESLQIRTPVFLKLGRIIKN